MTGPISTPRYSAEDFETASVRSAAPSYVSEAPSYHSNAHHSEATPAYSPSAPRAAAAPGTAPRQVGAPAPRHETVGLPPVPAMPHVSIPSLNNFRTPMWSTTNAPAARQYHSVAERRINSGRYGGAGDIGSGTRRTSTPEQQQKQGESSGGSRGSDSRPLEDPYLVGEVAAARAKRERLMRENGDDILVREDKQWDWLLAEMRTWDERERSWSKFRQMHSAQRKRGLRRLGGLL